MHIVKSSARGYRKAQLDKFFKKRRVQWIRDDEIHILKEVIEKFGNATCGICHGVRTGYECKKLAELLGIRVLGTDIGPIEGEDLIGNWDFHNQRQEWINKFSFVYTNSFDHSNRPKEAIKTWTQQLREDGLFILHWSTDHDKIGDRADCFSATCEECIDLLQEELVFITVISTKGKRKLIVSRKST